MLDEYSEDYGIDINRQIPEQQKQQIVGNPLPYQSAPQYQQQPIAAQQNYYQSPQPPQQPQYQQPYQNYAQPNVPQQPQQPRSRLDSIFSEESKDLKDLLNSENGGGCLKQIFFVFLAIAIIIGSFWVSFIFGKKLFMPEQTSIKNELPAFLKKKPGSALRDTFDRVQKATGTKGLFKQITTGPETPRVIPPEIRRIPIQTKTIKQAQVIQPATRKTVTVRSIAPTTKLYRVIAGNYATRQMAQDAARNLKADGFNNFIYQADGMFRIQMGAFKNKSGATQYMKKAQEFGYNASISVK